MNREKQPPTMREDDMNGRSPWGCLAATAAAILAVLTAMVLVTLLLTL